MARYILLSEKSKDTCGATIFTYGISGGGLQAHNLANDKEKVKRLIKIFNSNDLSYVHFHDVIDDMRDDIEAL